MTISNSLKILIVSSVISISISSTAYADPATIIGILFKIYQAASDQANHPKVSPDAPQTLQPGNFVRGSGDNASEKGSNLSQNEQKESGSITDSSNHQNARVDENGAVNVDYLTKQDKLDNNALYLEEFNARKLSNSQFEKLYYGRCFGCAFVRNNVTLKNATNQEKIDLEISLQKREGQQSEAKKYSIAFHNHVYKVIQLMSLSFVELKELKDSHTTQNKEFNLDPANDAIHMKSYHKGGVLFYEYAHQELGTHCLWGLGGKSEYLSDCDKLLALQMKEYKATHKHVNTKLSNQEIKQIAYEINPHEVWNNK